MNPEKTYAFLLENCPVMEGKVGATISIYMTCERVNQNLYNICTSAAYWQMREDT
jgi:hypothetical protein